MRKIGFLISAVAIAATVGCGGENPASAAGQDTTSDPASVGGSANPLSNEGTIALKFDQPVMASEQLQVTWLDVGDSRCPEGVSCVWEGEVTITIGVVKSGQDLGVFDIRLHDGEEDKAIASVDGQTIHFLDMVPCQT